MKFDDLVKLYTEAHIQDVMPKQFFNFIKKYKNQKNDYTLFVQFSNYAGSNLELGGYGNPDHMDPIGVYTYPLKYVIDYPADIRYGSNAKFLRVIRNVSPMNTLVLSKMTYDKAASLLRTMGLNPLDLGRVGKHFKLKRNSSLYGRQFFACVQHVFKPGEKPQLRSGAEQTKLLKKVCKVVEDRATTRSTAVINPSEPQQAIFLTRDSLRVEEVFPLRVETTDNLMSKTDSDVVLAQRIATQIFMNLGDNIKDQPLTKHNQNEKANRYSRQYDFFSKKGMRLHIKFEAQIPAKWSFSEPTKFKDMKTNTRSYPVVEIWGPHGRFKSTYSMATKSKEIANDFASRYRQRELDPTFNPLTMKGHQEDVARAEEENKRKAVEEQKQKDLKEEQDFRNDYLLPAMKKEHVNIPLLDEVRYLSTFQYLLNVLHGRVNDVHPQTNTATEEDLNYVWEKSTVVLKILNRRYNDRTLDHIKILFNKLALGRPVWRRIYPWIVRLS